jgi:hypothetical protein
MKFRIVFWDVVPCKIIVDRRFRGTCCPHHQGWDPWRQHTSETSVDNHFTRQYIPEDNSELHTRGRENLKSHSSPWWWRQHVPLKRRSTIILHGSTSQKTILNFILAAVRTWNLTDVTKFLRWITCTLQCNISYKIKQVSRDAGKEMVYNTDRVSECEAQSAIIPFVWIIIRK